LDDTCRTRAKQDDRRIFDAHGIRIERTSEGEFLIMTERRANPERLFRLADGLAQGYDIFVYRTEDPVEAVLSPNYFMRLHTRVSRDDLIQVRARDGEVLRIGTLAVLRVAFHEVVVGVFEAFKEIVPFAAETASVPASGPRVLKGGGKVIWNPSRRRHEVIVDTEVVFATTDKELAGAVARGAAPIPAAEPAAA
jgi:hypothetical protein